MEILEGVDLPNQLVEDHRNGKLVLFVGAGASISPPASLPDFEDLSTCLGRQAEHRARLDSESIDQYLGILDMANFDVNRAAATVLSNGGAPNPVHEALVELAQASGSPKIVTTNFDTFLQEAASKLGSEMKVWAGPALPLGDAFEGIVQLHGSLDESSEDFVLTDGSFGAAYLTRGWATRFLLDVFNNNSVLFVGYSHSDPVMRYISSALRENTRRFALVGEKDGNRGDRARVFSELGIEVIGYPNVDKHRLLPEILARWAEYASMNQPERRSELKRALDHLPSVSPFQKQILAECLRAEGEFENLVGLIFRTPSEQHGEIKRWLEKTDIFRSLFNRELIVPQNTWKRDLLNKWLATYYFANEARSTELWRDFRLHGTCLAKDFYDQLIKECHSLSGGANRRAAQLALFLGTSIPGITAPLLTSKALDENPRLLPISAPEVSAMLQSWVEICELGDEVPLFHLNWAASFEDLAAGLAVADRDPESDFTTAVETALERGQLLANEFFRSSERDPIAGSIVQLEDIYPYPYPRHPIYPVIDYLVGVAKHESFVTSRRDKWLSSVSILLRRVAVLSHKYQLDGESALKFCMESSSWGDPQTFFEMVDAVSWLAADTPYETQQQVFLALGKLDCPDAEKQQHVREMKRRLSKIREVASEDGNFPALVDPANLSPREKTKNLVVQEAETALREVIELAKSSSAVNDDHIYLILSRVDNRELLKHLDLFQASVAECTNLATARVLLGTASQLVQLSRNAVISDMQGLIQEFVSLALRLCSDADGADDMQFSAFRSGVLELAIANERNIRNAHQVGVATHFNEVFNALVPECGMNPEAVATATKHLDFFLENYPDIAENRVLPLLDDKTVKDAAWRGLISAKPRLTALGASRFRARLQEGWAYVQDKSDLAPALMSWIAETAEAGILPAEEITSILLEGVALSSPSGRASLLRLFNRRLFSNSERLLWDNGYSDFIHKRMQGIPRDLTREEIVELADLPAYAYQVLGEFVDQLTELAGVFDVKINSVPGVFENMARLDSIDDQTVERLANFYHERMKRAGIDTTAAHAFDVRLRNRSAGTHLDAFKDSLRNF